jgi:hypothetical protein
MPWQQQPADQRHTTSETLTLTGRLTEKVNPQATDEIAKT